jgi:hypothetical protein
MPQEVSIVSTLTNQVPGMVALIVVVLLFLRSIEKRDQMMSQRDQMFIDQMNKITDRLTALETLAISHDVASKSAQKESSETLERLEKKMEVISRRIGK